MIKYKVKYNVYLPNGSPPPKHKFLGTWKTLQTAKKYAKWPGAIIRIVVNGELGARVK